MRTDLKYVEHCTKTGKIMYQTRQEAELAIGEINHKEKATVSDFYLNSYQCTGYLNCGAWHIGRKHKDADRALLDAIRVIRAHPIDEGFTITGERSRKSAGSRKRSDPTRRKSGRRLREPGQQSPQ